MSKKTSTTAKQKTGKTATLSQKHKAEAQQLAQNLEGLQPEVQAEASAQLPVAARAEQIETQGKAIQAKLQASPEDEAREVDNAARADAILTAVQDYDHGGQSLLLEAAAVGAAKEEKDDKAAAWQWSDALPLLAVLGGVAAIGSIKPGSGGGAPAAGASGASGVVFDTPVTNAIVFRDANGNGKWDAGESITVTDSQGGFSNLGGTGNIVATSLDRLVARINNEDVTYSASEYAAFNAVSGLRLTSGVAIDVGTDLDLGTADDFVWSGTYTAASNMTQGAVGVYVTAVSSLVTAYLASQGVMAPTQAQIDAAVTELKAIFVFNGDSGLADQGANVQFFTSDLNGHVTKIMGEAIAKAEAAGSDVQQAIRDALEQLAQAAVTAQDEENTLDLTNPADLQDIFGLSTDEATTLAQQTANAGPAVYSIWFTEDGSAVASPSLEGLATIATDGPIGNITVLTQGEETEASLTVEPADSTVALQGATILVRAAGDSSASDLTLSNATGEAHQLSVLATGDSAWASANVQLQGDLSGNVAVQASGGIDIYYSHEVQTIDLSGADAPVAGDIIMLVIDGEPLEYTVTAEDAASEDVLAAVVAGLNNLASDAGIAAAATVSAGVVEITWTDGEDHVLATLHVSHASTETVIEITGAASTDPETFNETQVFDLTESAAAAAGDVISLAIDGETLSYTVTADDITDDTVQSSVLAAFIAQAADAGIAADATFEGGVLTIAWTDGLDHDPAVFTMDHTTTTVTDVTAVEDTAGGVETTGSNSSAYLSLEISGAISGNVTVEASNVSADAQAYFNSIDEVITLEGGNVTVGAQGTDASANVHLHDANGSITSVDISATGDNASAYLHLSNAGDSADLLSVANVSVNADSSGNCGDVSSQASLELDGNMAVTGEISVTAAGSSDAAYISADTSQLTLGVAATSEDAAVGTNITVSASGSDTEANAYIHNASGTVGAIGVTSSANLGDASLTLLTGSDDVTIGSVTMLTTDNGWASADIHGNVAIDGDITVTASGSGGQASADINNWTDDVGSTALGGGDITILASGDNAEASADIRLASGTVNDISVTASGNGNQTDASLNLQTEGDGLTAASLTVTATGTDSAASADISGDMAITGDISVSATASGSCADVEINTSGSGATVLGVAATSEDAAIGSNITVSADVATATAVLNIGNASGTIESLAVTANDGTASLDIGVADESTQTINTVDVTSNGTGHASADVHGSADSTVAITGNVTVSANGALDPATLYVNGTDVNGATVLGTSADTAANDISVTASTGAEAYAYLNNASGQADELTVTAENGNADAGLDVGVASGDSLNVASLSVTASGSNDSAGANLWNHGASSELAITGSITVSAGGDSAHAYGDVNAVDWERDSEGTWTSGDAQGHVVLGVAGEAEVINLSYDVANNVVGGHLVTTITATADVLPGTAAVGADLTVEASGASADAAADIRNASGTVANISVTASSTDASAGLYLQTESYNGADGVTAASLAVTASGDDADASADISGDVAITGAISITASADGADATANLNTSGSGRTVLGVAATPEIAIETTVLVDAQIVETRTEVVRAGTAAVGSDLTVTASGASADASADLRNVSGIVEDITVTASGICSDAYLNLHIEDGEWLQAASLTVQADVYADESSNDAEAVISGNITIAGDIIVSGGDDVDADINTDGAGHTVLGGGNITVTADGDDSDADADIRNASGTVGDIRVTAGDLGDDADADLNLATESYDGVDGVTAASLTVEALGDSTDATAEINGVIAFTGDLRVVASDDSADASAHINTGGGADEYQEFFLPAVFGINGWSGASGDVLDVVVDGYTLSYTIGSMDSPGDRAQSLNAQADNLGLAVDFGMCGDAVLEAQWHDGRNHDLLQFSYNGNIGVLDEFYIEQDGFSTNASTVLGADGGASDITVSATSASADADAYIYQVSGSAGSIEVLAHGYDADAYLDLRVASGEQLESGNITVIASDTDGTAQIDINGNLVVNGDISVSAAGDASSADAEINNVGFSSSEDTVYAGETRLQGGDISVTASGDSADARAWVHNASGTLGDLNVVASDTGANATLDLRAQATGQHQLQIITLTEAELSALAERDTLGVWIDGTYFEADLAHAYYTSNSDKLAEFVQAIRDDGNYADLNADVYQDGNSLVIRWHDYENHAAPRQVQINGVNRGFSQSVNAVAPSLAFDNSSDVWVSASSSDAQAHAAVDSVAGTLGNTYVFASGDSNAHASLTMGLNGDLSGDVVVVADGVYNSATLDLHADASGRISLGSFNCQDVVVAAHGLGAQADASLSGLSGTLDDLTVVADVKNAEASANLQFAEGSLNYACMDAVDHQSTVRVTLDQTVRNGDVYVAGEGHAAVSFYVDERNATADQVNLWGMHNGDRSYHERGGDWWGYADIDLVARYNDVLDQPGAGLQTSCNDTLWDTRMTVYGFNVERDSINVIVQADDCGHLGTQDQLVRHDVAFLHEGDTTVAEAAFDAAIDDLLADARWYFDNYTGDAEQGYYYRQITLDPDVGSNYVRSFLVYDYDLGGDNVGASGLVALSDTTGLNERNVADRYDIVSQTEGYVSQSTDLAGAHAIDSLTVGAYEDGQNDQTYVVSHDADVMVSDITVEAINPGLGYGWDDTAYASLNMASRASVGCGDSWLELRQSDVNVIARGDDGEYAYADAYLSLRDAWGTLNSVTVEASNNAQASADLAYLSYWSDYDSLGSVKVHDMDVRAMDDNADATLSTVSSDLTFDYSVVNVTAGYDAQGNAEGAYESDARLYVNRYVDGDHRCGDVDGVISELNVRVDGDNSSALADLHRYAGDIGLLRVTADGYHSSADADVLFDNSMGAVNAVHEIYVRADGEGTDARASIDTTSSSNDIQLTGGDIYVGAFDSADASLDMTSAPLSGQASQIVVEANDSADARAWISGHDFSVTHERTSTDTWNDSSIRVSAGADSDARLAISGYGQYLDSVVLAAGESSDVYFSLDMTGFIDTLDIQVTGDNSYVSADIAQATYGGVVNVDGSANYYSSDALDEVIHENNVVDLAYRTATASEINIDNTGRDFERGGYAYDGGWYFASGDYDDTLQLNLLLDVADQDIPYTSQATLLAYRVQIDGWTDNDTISFAGESGDAGYNYEENWSEVSLTQLFRDADAALDGTVDYYFGVSAGNGYLFHDEDGTGITTVVELLGVTAFDDHQIRGTLIT